MRRGNGRRRRSGSRCGRRRCGSRSRRAARCARELRRRARWLAIGYLGDLSVYKVRLDGGVVMKAALANVTAAGRPADPGGEPGLADVGGRRRRGADAMSDAHPNSAAAAGRWGPAPRRPAFPYLWLGAVLPRAVPDRAQDQPVADRDRAAALHPGARFRPQGSRGSGSSSAACRSTITRCSAPTGSISPRI